MILDLRTIDLNLLVAFDAVARERSLLRASAALNMSSSALSHALARLRVLVGDELFLRTPAGMEPTEHALSLVGPIRNALDIVEAALSPVFDPATSRHRFVVALDNRSAMVLAAPLAKRVASEAPGVSLDIVPCGLVDLPSRLSHGGLDVAITCARLEGERLNGTALFEDDYVAMMRAEHPGRDAGIADAEALARFPHLSLSSIAEEDDFLDAALEERGLARHVAIRAPLLSAATILSGSDMIAVLGRKTATSFARASDLLVLELGVASPRSITAMVWHRRWDGTPAHLWLRAALKAVVEEDLS